MPGQHEQDRYVLETWSAVRTLWNRFDENAEQDIAGAYPHVQTFIVEEMFKQNRAPEIAAVAIVAQVVTDQIANTFTAEEKQHALAELNKLLQMNFSEAQGYMAIPFVHAFVNAWQVALKWSNEGKVDAAAREFLMGKIFGALTSDAAP